MESIKSFLENAGLYQKVEVNETTFTDLNDFYKGASQIEVYCPKCQKDRIFKKEKDWHKYNERKDKNSFDALFQYTPIIEQYNFNCTNDPLHVL